MTPSPSTAAFRFGFGLPQPDAAPAGAADMLALLAGPDVAAQQWPSVGMAQVFPVYQQFLLARSSDEQTQAARDAVKTATREIARQQLLGIRAALARAVGSPDGFRERLVRFWSNHFTTEAKAARERALPAAMTEDAIRPHVTGRFGDLLVAATLHPAMLQYLDQSQSMGPNSPFGTRHKRGINENLAREVMELHSLGVGAGYTQADVTQLAELFTGLYFGREGAEFRAAWAEPGAETVLGKTYDGEGTAPIVAALQDLAVRPETARHIARKLAVHFVADTPDPDLVTALERRFNDTGGDLLAVYGALLEHPAAWSAEAAKVRQPDEFIVAALRGLGLTAQDMLDFAQGPFQRMILAPMAAMGRPWGNPVGPNGFSEAAETWVTPQALAARISWAMEVPGRLVRDMPDPPAFAATVLGDRVGAQLQWAVARAENLREGVGLVLAAPEFNRR